MRKSVKFDLRVTPEDRALLDALALRAGLSRSEAVRTLIHEAALIVAANQDGRAVTVAPSGVVIA